MIVDYSSGKPTVTIDGIVYRLHNGSALCLSTPHDLAKLYKRLTSQGKCSP